MLATKRLCSSSDDDVDDDDGDAFSSASPSPDALGSFSASSTSSSARRWQSARASRGKPRAARRDGTTTAPRGESLERALDELAIQRLEEALLREREAVSAVAAAEAAAREPPHSDVDEVHEGSRRRRARCCRTAVAMRAKARDRERRARAPPPTPKPTPDAPEDGC